MSIPEASFLITKRGPCDFLFSLTGPSPASFDVDTVTWLIEEEREVNGVWKFMPLPDSPIYGITEVGYVFPGPGQYRVSLRMKTPQGGSVAPYGEIVKILPGETPAEEIPVEEPPVVEPPQVVPQPEGPTRPDTGAAWTIIDRGLSWLIEQEKQGMVGAFLVGAAVGVAAVWLYLVGGI